MRPADPREKVSLLPELEGDHRGDEPLAAVCAGKAQGRAPGRAADPGGNGERAAAKCLRSCANLTEAAGLIAECPNSDGGSVKEERPAGIILGEVVYDDAFNHLQSDAAGVLLLMNASGENYLPKIQRIC